MGEEFVYHGSKIQNLTILHPRDGGFGRNYVYAADDKVQAAIFINRPGGSYVATWGKRKDGKIFFCERKEGIFDEWYSELRGSIYVLDKKQFHQVGFLHPFEWVADKPVEVLEEIQIDNLKDYFLECEKEGRFVLIPFDHRRELYPDDEDIVRTAIIIMRKYHHQEERILAEIRCHQPHLENAIKRELAKIKVK